jgi:hypothetical protein
MSQDYFEIVSEMFEQVQGIYLDRGTSLFENTGNDLGGALAILVHTVYHLGEIRQALCTIQQ